MPTSQVEEQERGLEEITRSTSFSSCELLDFCDSFIILKQKQAGTQPVKPSIKIKSFLSVHWFYIGFNCHIRENPKNILTSVK